MRVLADIEPREVMFFFEELSGKHRCSRFEKSATDFIADFASQHGLEHHRDAVQNIIVKKPGTPGYEQAPTVILHGHLDMVCKIDDGVTHDFATDGVKLKVDGNYIRAQGTTLGADNGLGIAYMLALLASTDIPHPPLECVMTAMEEMGKVGGDSVDLTLLSGKRMIDFNWIDENQLLAGCSGDVTCRVEIDAQTEAAGAGRAALSVGIGGGLGGHCEFDIHLERANSIVLLGRLLRAALRVSDVRLAAISAGVQNNVIAAEGSMTLSVPHHDLDAAEQALADVAAALGREFRLADPDLRVASRRVDDAPARTFSRRATRQVGQVIALLPNGIQSQNLEVPGNWSTANNLGRLMTVGEKVQIFCTMTSAATSRKHALLDTVMALAEIAGEGVHAEQIGLDAPEFRPNPNSRMLEIAKSSYERVMGRVPDVLVSVCSLELGMFTQRIDGLDTIGIGTNLFDLHSPKEHMDHTSAARVWPLIKDVMRHLDQ